VLVKPNVRIIGEAEIFQFLLLFSIYHPKFNPLSDPRSVHRCDAKDTGIPEVYGLHLTDAPISGIRDPIEYLTTKSYEEDE